MSFLSGGVAKFKGFFKEEGLDAELVQITANVSIAALASGNVDYNLILQSVVTGNLRGLPIKVAGILIERPNHVVVVNPKITRFADLKGTEDRDEFLRLGDRYLGATDGGTFQAQPAIKTFSSSPRAAAPAGWRNWSPAWSMPRWWRRRRMRWRKRAVSRVWCGRAIFCSFRSTASACTSKS